ncbi:hypothetical protein BTO06_14255 [Tenacibaculum sp. SZ-18]|uniref:hypothetical protein n=1 Tax=Tenacibaculum sp. SZ-18 TaxID=754423 RepID=UPI000C2D6155|nr:hypothetical protein [Tenacibaculum sp. SZ-18]AUC16251.1 hypothetical protein BTO06_14255 [Tenacibaculum sp. SZ-18]
MKTSFFTYFFAITLIASIALPTYFSISDRGYEYSSVITDFEDDSEQGESNHDTDIKIIYFNKENLILNLFKIKQKIIYLSSRYTALALKVDSPPPEFS